MLTVAEIQAALKLQPLTLKNLDKAITSVEYDSRRVKPGSLFVAISGAGVRDGWQYIPQATRAGAIAILTERPPDPAWSIEWGDQPPAYFVAPKSLRALATLAAYWRAKHPIRAIGITGAVGKTSAKDTLAWVLAQRFPTLKNDASLNNEIGVPVTALRLSPVHQRWVQELGTYGPGEVTWLCALVRPSTALVTNIGPSHLERMGSLENIAQCEGEVVDCLPDDGIACLNRDDPLVYAMRERTGARIVSYGLSAESDLRGVDPVENGLAGVRLTLVWQRQSLPVQIPIPGKPGIWTALGAGAAALAEGVSLREVADGLASLPAAPRLKGLPGRNGSLVLDDHYNASPVSVHAALDVFEQTPPPAGGRRVAIFADMLELGPIEEGGHREIGERVGRIAQKLIVVGPRAERFMAPAAQAAGLNDIEAFGDAGEVEFEPQPGDVILVKGSRGMYMERMVAKLVAPEL